MNIFIELLLRKLRAFYLRKHPKTYSLERETDPQRSSDIIYDLLCAPKPCMIARFGMVEFNCLLNYLGKRQGKRDYCGFIEGKVFPWWWTRDTIFKMTNNAGFFPSTPGNLERFSKLLLEDTNDLDVLASWINDEKILEQNLQEVKKIFLPYLEPYWSKNPWTRALKGKNILVVHPFSSLIKLQYEEKRKYLFKNENVLPEFNLITFKAIQSMGGNGNGFHSWFEALQWMKSEISKIEFDICIIGCGAYGFHLAAHVKRLGKKAIHMGGATQLLFGIRGKRWDDVNYGVNEWGLPSGFYVDLVNEYWVRPGEAERPKNADSVENACYW